MITTFCLGMAIGAVLMAVIVCVSLAWNKVSWKEENE